ncbi:MAG TPA: AraC family transcriptional regulator, partial [Burkholderiaceae bacterium]|nr:AraC family transcriptional regulator [Burkholderiaceae bacterium]
MNTQHPAVPALGQWSTGDGAPADATDAWQAALSDNYGLWQVSKAVDSGFSARIRNRNFSGLRVVECVCDPCSGRRIPQLISRDASSFIGVQITKSGSERFHFGGEVISVGSGDLVIWTSDHPTEFTVTEKLHKV